MSGDGVPDQPRSARVSRLSGTLPRVPNAPRTPLRSIRIPDELWEAAQAKAEEKGESVSDVVRRALERYVKRP